MYILLLWRCKVKKYFPMEWYSACYEKLLDVMRNRKGLTHFELLEYFLLIVMVIGVALVLGTSFSEVQAKIWATLHNELLSLN
jgi:uncharacterized protein involved in cysteine biosynthesis